MDFGITEKIEQMQQLITGKSASMIIVVSLIILVFWFLPAILAVFLNRRNFKIILAACIPAGFSFVAWFALICWAITGKLIDKKKAEESE